MKLTLLDYVQQVLASLDSEEVNSIGDTTESRQVANIVRTTYFNIITRAELPEHMQQMHLDSSGDLDKPVLMYLPATFARIAWVEYNTSDDPSQLEYTDITVLSNKDFFDYVRKFDISQTNVDSMTIDSFTYYFKNDSDPTCCTVLKDASVVFDAYDSTLESTLQSSKSIIYGQVIPTFTMEDDFYPDLDESQVPLLLNEAKSLAFLELKQVGHDKAEQEARRQWSALMDNKHLVPVNRLDELPNYGRK